MQCKLISRRIASHIRSPKHPYIVFEETSREKLGTGRTRTHDLPNTSRALYHWATVPSDFVGEINSLKVRRNRISLAGCEFEPRVEPTFSLDLTTPESTSNPTTTLCVCSANWSAGGLPHTSDRLNTHIYYLKKHREKNLEPVGLEPTTSRIQVGCSTTKPRFLLTLQEKLISWKSDEIATH